MRVFAIIAFILSVNIASAQLHIPPSCGENYTLDWSSTPIASNEFDWLAAGALSNTFNNVDDSGIDFTIAFTGDTSTLGLWGSVQTPKVGNSATTIEENLDLKTDGFTATGITCTITFSSPIYALSFDLSHVNSNGTNGDMYTITAQTTGGSTIYPTFTNSSNPSYTTNNATGVVDANASSTTGTNAIVGINFLDDDYITSVTFLWENCSTCSPNVQHGSGLGNFSFCIPQTLDFDGVNDYIDRAAFLGGKTEATMMTWMKLDSGFDGGEIMGQRNFRLYIDASNKLKAFIRTDSGLDIHSSDIPEALLSNNMWYHTALKFDSTTGNIDLYLNGNNIWNYNNAALIGTTLNNEAIWNSDHDFEIGRNTELNNNYFEGSIYETRVYNKALTDNQLHRQINQEIEDNLGSVRGNIIPKDIEGLAWSDLELYYKMGIIETGYTPDESNTNVDGHLNNMRTYQERTAPLPYETTTSCSGDWSNSSNWVHGNIWDITSAHPESAIVKINGNIETNIDHSMVGLIIDSSSKLEINGNSGLFNSWYLKLDGDIDLQGESQLIQGEDSTLDVTSAGTLERDQQGTRDFYTYNYWSSPVGIKNTSSNNNSYTLPDVLNDGSVTTNSMPISFIGGHDGSPGLPGTTPISIAHYWVWKYVNKTSDDYASWQHVRNTGSLLAGEGYTMKGVTNSATSFIEEQNYIHNGKPNNGDISLNMSAGNDYLIGNPYPSAIDADEFILDNISDGAGRAATNIINGTLYFWDHFAGNTHVTREYQGGYATYTLMGGIKATSTDSRLNASGQEGTKVPQQFIPVSQGFFVVADAGGTISFKNSQRVFRKEAADPSLFIKGTSKKGKFTATTKTNVDDRQKIRLMLHSPKGYHRQLLVGVDQRATNNIDKGFDAPLYEDNVEDLFWIFNEKNFVIQAVNNFDDSQILPLGLKTNIEGLATIKIDEIENIDSSKNIYLHDKELNIFHDLKEGQYDVQLATGEYLNRFELTFSNASQSLSNDDVTTTNPIDVYFSNEEMNVVVHNPNSQYIKSVEMINILGQTLFKKDIDSNDDYLKYNASQMKTGTYVLKIETEFGKLSKKVLIK